MLGLCTAMILSWLVCNAITIVHAHIIIQVSKPVIYVLCGC